MAITIASIDPSPDGAGIVSFAIDGPRLGERLDGDGFEIDGWVLGLRGPVVAIEVGLGNQLRCRVPVARERLDVATVFPDRPWAAEAGFRGWVATAGLPSRFALEVRAILPGGDAVPCATLRGLQVPDPYAHLAGDDEDAAGWAGPDFVVIGAQRSGSTSLYQYLTEHPLVVPAAIKEVKYFSYFHDRPWGWYRRQFPAALPAGGQTGEATPYYLFHPHAARRIRERVPAARLIAVLRNPVDRAYSHYLHEQRRGTETRSFEEALAREADRLAGEEAKMRADESYSSLAHQHFSYQARGRYAEQLHRWYGLFPQHQVLVLRSEDLYTDPASTLDRVTAFLGLPPAALQETPAYNKEIYPPMRRQTRVALGNAFAQSNEELRTMLGNGFGWDDPPS